MPNWKLYSTAQHQYRKTLEETHVHSMIADMQCDTYVHTYTHTYVRIYWTMHIHIHICTYLSWVLGIYLHDKRSVCPEWLVRHLHIRSADGIFTRVVEEVLVHPGLDLKGIGINNELRTYVRTYITLIDKQCNGHQLKRGVLTRYSIRIQVYQIVVITHFQ